MINKCPKCGAKFKFGMPTSKAFPANAKWYKKKYSPACPKCGVFLITNTHKYENYFAFFYMAVTASLLIAFWFIKGLMFGWAIVAVLLIVLAVWIAVKHTVLANWNRWQIDETKKL